MTNPRIAKWLRPHRLLSADIIGTPLAAPRKGDVEDDAAGLAGREGGACPDAMPD